MQYVVLVMIGAALCCIGIVNLHGDISTVHSYHRWAVSKENQARYSKLMGTGTLIAGLFVAAAGTVQMIYETEFAWWLLLAGVVAGFAVMVYAQFTAGGFLQQLRTLMAIWREKRRP